MGEHVTDCAHPPRCRCGALCWASGKSTDEPCWGVIGVSEDYPGIYMHFCQGHGHPEDNQPYQGPPPTANSQAEDSASAAH